MVRWIVSLLSGVVPSVSFPRIPHWSSMLMIPVSPRLGSHLRAKSSTMALMIPPLILQNSKAVLNDTRYLMLVPVLSVVVPMSIHCVSIAIWDTTPVLSVDPNVHNPMCVPYRCRPRALTAYDFLLQHRHTRKRSLFRCLDSIMSIMLWQLLQLPRRWRWAGMRFRAALGKPRLSLDEGSRSRPSDALFACCWQKI